MISLLYYNKSTVVFTFGRSLFHLWISLHASNQEHVREGFEYQLLSLYFKMDRIKGPNLMQTLLIFPQNQKVLTGSMYILLFEVHFHRLIVHVSNHTLRNCLPHIMEQRWSWARVFWSITSEFTFKGLSKKIFTVTLDNFYFISNLTQNHFFLMWNNTLTSMKWSKSYLK